jgi:hypothetical protein
MNGRLWHIFLVTWRARRILMTYCRIETWHEISCTEYILSDKGGVNFEWMMSLIIFFVTKAPWWPMLFNRQRPAGFEEKGSDFPSVSYT